MDIAWWQFPLAGSLIILVVLAITFGVIRARQCSRPTATGNDASEQSNALARELVHEIRNPLNSVGLNLQLIEEDLATVESRKASEVLKRTRRIRIEIERLNQILTDFRRFTGLPPLSLQKCNLGALIVEVLEFTEPEAQSRNITVVRELQDLPSIELDPDQFKQALWNLIINATQAMETGGTLTIHASALNGNIKLDVRDTGVGISPDIADRMFDLFFHTKENGTGVGLAIVKRVIEGHGGSVSVDSLPNQGATVSIVIPINR
ncbi:MAG: ATP-binding protein [Candidatus Poribacteria bacterium]|nr:ATP-binding protein [Candidatus Poribacteria bacterium]MDE0505260.1 ATP-binding protein [Candidatus Poribacteria bacterium]